jgi:hypothetical protein
MRIRLHGTRDEIATTLDQLRAVLHVQDVSRIYADRKPSPLARLYLTVDRPETTEQGGQSRT